MASATTITATKQISISSLLTTVLSLLLVLTLSWPSLLCVDAKTAKPKKKTKPQLYERYKNICQGLPTIKKHHESHLQQLVKTIGGTKIAGKTPQNEAACWMFRQKRGYNIQRYALAVTYYASKGAQWDTNTNWMTPKHECTWHGVTCNLFGAVIELDLGYIELEGLIPRELGMLGSLRDLDLHGNDLQGIIPHMLMVGMKNGQYLRLQMNGLFGSIHKEISRMTNLKELYLFGNFFAGTIPKQLSELKKLEIVDLYANQLTGTIPKELAKLPNLKYLDLHDNNLVGTMPKEICDKKIRNLGGGLPRKIPRGEVRLLHGLLRRYTRVVLL
mmetsp:Transcript_26079/g.54617  ORF Transcript_26079/g.54617 Transcript_26079/m.54617 type:complete len:330 (-) Transcript_26079:134-1123(-)